MQLLIFQLPLLLSVVAGGTELLTFEEEEQTRSVNQILMNPEYNFNIDRVKNDICLLHLSESLMWTDWVQPIALPEQNQEIDAGTLAILTGWGSTNVSGKKD